MSLDLHRLRSFVTVADELSFTRAARLLHMTQPALSRQIRQLEDDLGVQLFERDRRGTALTDPGRHLLDGARPLLSASVGLERRVRASARGQTTFSIGFMPGVDSVPIVRQFQQAVPDVVIEVVYTAVTDQVAYLLDGRVDVCFVRLPLAADGFRVIPLFPEPRVAALPDDTGAAGEAVALTELNGLCLLQDGADVPEWRGPCEVRKGARGSGPRPPTIEESLERVAAGAGFFVMPAGLASYYRHPHVRYAALPEVAPRMVALAYDPHRSMPELEQFAAISVEHLAG